MPVNIQQILNDVKNLNAQDKAFIARCLITSLETVQEEGVDRAWHELSEKRYKDLVTGKIKPVSWESIKKQVLE